MRSTHGPSCTGDRDARGPAGAGEAYGPCLGGLSRDVPMGRPHGCRPPCVEAHDGAGPTEAR